MTFTNHTVLETDFIERPYPFGDIEDYLLEKGELIDSDITRYRDLNEEISYYHINSCSVKTKYKTSGSSSIGHIEVYSHPDNLRDGLVKKLIGLLPELRVKNDVRDPII